MQRIFALKALWSVAILFDSVVQANDVVVGRVQKKLRRRQLESLLPDPKTISFKSDDSAASIARKYARQCTENPYLSSLDTSPDEIARRMFSWLDNELEFQAEFTMDRKNMNRDHNRFAVFEPMATCTPDCVGGRCGADTSKEVCGLSTLQPGCVVYSIGGNNLWQFEMDILAKTPCEVHTFDCTGDRERFQVPQHERLHFHYICLGDRNKVVPGMGEIWTIETMQKSLGHSQIDLLKVDVEGYEWPLFESWPEITDIRSREFALPMQVLVEIHYTSFMPELTHGEQNWDWKHPGELVKLQSHLLKIGYMTAIRDDNEYCPQCTELTLLRVQCPAHANTHFAFNSS